MSKVWHHGASIFHIWIAHIVFMDQGELDIYVFPICRGFNLAYLYAILMDEQSMSPIFQKSQI